MSGSIRLSPLAHTWLLDLDGTILKHNGYLEDGEDSLLPGAADFMASIPQEDAVIFLTSRKPECAPRTEDFLARHKIRYDKIIYGLPYGERVLINDKKPSGLATALAINPDRNKLPDISIDIDPAL